MSDWYAQQSGDWNSISWNLMPDGSGSSGNPMPGDTAYANTYLVNIHGVDLSSIILGSGDGSFWSSIWYAMGSGKYTEVWWNSEQTGLGYVDPMGHLPITPPNGCTTDLSCNGFVIDVADVNVTPFGGLALNGTDWWSSKVYASGSGAWESCGWNTSSDGNGFGVEWPIPFTSGTPTAYIGTYNITATAAQVLVPVTVGTGSLVIGDPGNVYPAESDVLLNVQYGPTGTEYTGTLAAGGYTYGSDNPAKVTTDAEAPGTLDLSDYVLASGMVFPSEGSVDKTSGPVSYGPTGTEYFPAGEFVPLANLVSASDVRFGVPIYSGAGEGYVGTLVGIVDSTGTHYDSGLILNGTWSQVGIFYYANSAYHVASTGVINGMGTYHSLAYVTEAGGGTYHEATIAEVKVGVSFGADSNLTGTYNPATGYTYGDDDPSKVLTTADGAGTCDITNATPENIKKDVVIAGVTGTLEEGTGVTQIAIAPGTYQVIVGSKLAIVGG